MKRWAIAFAAAILGSLLVLLHRSAAPSLLYDTDTRVLLETIRTKNAPFSWFASDWPLYNHFYRPLSTLFFELDNRLYGHAAWGYGLTNCLLCVACTLLLFWFLREFTDSPVLAGTGTLLFSLWETSASYPLSEIAQWLPWAIIGGGIVRHRLKVRMWLPAALVAWEFAYQIGADRDIESRTLEWLPGRTALVMTVFNLAALAAYARYERVSADRRLPEPDPLAPPQTRSAVAVRPARFASVWALLAIVFTLLSMAAYEQGIMAPALLLATACTFRWRGYLVRWGWQAAFWACIGVYLLVRHRYVPSTPSGYQLQQFRTGPGVWISISSYTFPSLFAVGTMGVWVGDLPSALLTSEPWQMLFSVAMDAATLIRVRTRWQFTFAGWGMALLAFLPMAWVKEFAHYHYLPLAMRSLFVVMLGWVACEGALSAWSPQRRQAPPRPNPAPGSLLHP